MTIAATPRRSPVYTGNGVATTYAFAFKVLDATTLVVTVADENDLNSQVLVNGVDYTVTLNGDQNASPGGSISYASLPVGHRLVITSDTDSSQPTAISNLGAFHANVLEGALDRIVILHQQQQEQLDRCVKVAATSEQDPSTLLDTAVTNASNYATAAAASASAASGSAGAASASAAAAAAIVTNSPLSFRNKIINGGFDIWQRGTSGTASGFCADRWANSHSGTTVSYSRQTFTLGQTNVVGNPTYYYRSAVSSVAGAGKYALLYQKIEGVQTLAGKTVTLSFDAKADASKNIAVELVQDFGIGGSPSAAVTGIGAQLVALTTSWQRKSITISLPSIAGKTLGTSNNDSLSVFFWFDAGSNYNARTDTLGQQSGTFDIANVQIEEGSVATPFEQRPLGLELSLCQRYYETIASRTFTAYATTGYGAGNHLDFAATKRATPTITKVSETGVTNFSVGATTGTIDGIEYRIAPMGDGMVRATCGFTAEAEL